MRYLAILGRLPKISLAELESLYKGVRYLGGNLATFESSAKPEIDRLGGTVKLAEPIKGGPEKFLIEQNYTSKYIIGVSDYSKGASARKSQALALKLKRVLKKYGMSARVLDNKSAELSTATVYHNQLGEKPGHYELIKINNDWYVGIGVQNINAYRDRDQNRPARDAKNGMLPPKLAQILINLCGPLKSGATVLDPFCGTGVVLQEAILMGRRGYGTDASERIVGFAKKNLEWLGKGEFKLDVGDAQDFKWEQPIDAVAFEGYLGPPMSQPPADIKMKSVVADIYPLYYHTLRNLSSQLESGTPVVMALPAWFRPDGHYRRLNILDEVDKLGYNVIKYTNTSQEDLLYFRDGQVVAREIIVLRKK
ncbi:methyltransferase domain-containing protein [Candidatus Saccharibacteria bacterium]|nr:methyltransferase domain-containing protein [Candidatus Saccharibacteria bacterium]